MASPQYPNAPIAYGQSLGSVAPPQSHRNGGQLVAAAACEQLDPGVRHAMEEIHEILSQNRAAIDKLSQEDWSSVERARTQGQALGHGLESVAGTMAAEHFRLLSLKRRYTRHLLRSDEYLRGLERMRPADRSPGLRLQQPTGPFRELLASFEAKMANYAAQIRDLELFLQGEAAAPAPEVAVAAVAAQQMDMLLAAAHRLSVLEERIAVAQRGGT